MAPRPTLRKVAPRRAESRGSAKKSRVASVSGSASTTNRARPSHGPSPSAVIRSSKGPPGACSARPTPTVCIPAARSALATAVPMCPVP